MNRSKDRGINKILVVGAGAVGGYFGGILFEAGLDITFLVRPNTFEQISKQGLKIESTQGDFLIHPPVVQETDQLEAVDLIILAIKCHDVKAVFPDIAVLVEKGAMILTLQNGVGTEDEIIAHYNKDCVVAGVAFITSRLEKPGHIVHSRRGMITVGELSGDKSPRSLAINTLLTGAGISSRLTSKIRQKKWEKLCWNATFNPLSVILNHPISLILENPHLMKIVREGIDEVVAVAAEEKIIINPKIIETIISDTHDLKDFYTSMYEDVQNGKITEIEYLNGDLVKRGKKWGVPTPINQTLYALVKGLEMKYLQSTHT